MPCIVRLGSGRRLPLGGYVRVWKQLIDLARVDPDATGRFSPVTMDEISTVGEALRAFRAGMHDRINRHMPGYRVGRKWTLEWQTSVSRVARLLDQRVAAVRSREIPDRAMRHRLQHRLDDD